jgi:hypothetical protein
MDDLKDFPVFWSSLAPAKVSEDSIQVLHLLKKAVDDRSSDQRGKISAIHVLLLAVDGVTRACAMVELILEAP